MRAVSKKEIISHCPSVQSPQHGFEKPLRRRERVTDSEKQVIYINAVFEEVTRRSRKSLRENPISYQELFHPEYRVRVLTRLEQAVRAGQFDEEFRLVRPDRAIRWVWVRGFPVRDHAGTVLRLVGTAQDITARKCAEEQMARHLSLAESARAEADAFRRITLVLTQNLSMNSVGKRLRGIRISALGFAFRSSLHKMSWDHYRWEIYAWMRSCRNIYDWQSLLQFLPPSRFRMHGFMCGPRSTQQNSSNDLETSDARASRTLRIKPPNSSTHCPDLFR